MYCRDGRGMEWEGGAGQCIGCFKGELKIEVPNTADPKGVMAEQHILNGLYRVYTSNYLELDGIYRPTPSI